MKPVDAKAMYTLDLSELRDPMGQQQFQGYDGRAPLVQKWMKDDPSVQGIVDLVMILSLTLIDADKRQYVSFMFKDHHGKFISPAVAEICADQLDLSNFKVATVHYGLV